MATYNTSVTSSINYIPFNLSASEGLTLNIDNPDQGSSYVVLETRRNQDGFYDENTPKNAQGTYTLNGATYVVSDDYKTGFVIPPGGGTASFDNTNYVSGSDFRVVGTAYKPFYDLLLDRWPNSAAAYSLRRLNSYYDGPAVRVRRSIDDQETDIGFIGTSLDIATLESFCSGGDGYVETWYDQSGNNAHGIEIVASNQPQIVSGGSVLLQNGKPCLDFDGVNDRLKCGSWKISGTDNRSFFWVSKADSNASGTYLSIGEFGLPTNSYQYIFTTEMALRVYGGNEVYSSPSTNQILITNIHNGPQTTDNTAYYNGVETTSISSVTSNINTINTEQYIGYQIPAAGDYYNGTYQELIIFDSDQSSNRPGIESDINSHYKIY